MCVTEFLSTWAVIAVVLFFLVPVCVGIAAFFSIAIGVAGNDDDGDVAVIVVFIVEPLVTPFLTAIKIQPMCGRD